MKKLLAFITLLVYFVVSTGFVVSVHYCMNKIASVQLGDTSSDECGKCGMHIEKSGGCCKDDVKMMKIQVDQAFAKVAIPDFNFHANPPAAETVLPPSQLINLFESYPLSHGPPLSKQDTYLKNCVFRL